MPGFPKDTLHVSMKSKKVLSTLMFRMMVSSEAGSSLCTAVRQEELHYWHRLKHSIITG